MLLYNTQKIENPQPEKHEKTGRGLRKKEGMQKYNFLAK